MKQAYIEQITVYLNACNDIPLLDLICRLLRKSF